MSSHLAPSSRQHYKNTWVRYKSFCASLSIDHCCPNPAEFVLFISQLFSEDVSPATITSMMSHVSYWLQMKGYSVQVLDDFLVKKALSGLRKLNPTEDIRLPITYPILEKLLSVIPQVLECCYSRSLFASIFTLSFFALCRLSEVAGQRPRLHLEDISFPDSKLHSPMTVCFRLYKHNTGGRPSVLEVSCQCGENKHVCPGKLMKAFLQVRVPSSKKSAVFLTRDGTPISEAFFRSTLKTCCLILGLGPQYTSHSFRIGGASWAASKGYSSEQIKKMGRWKSDAYKKYIRNTTFIV